jgi:hypothetical protein
MYLGSDIFPRQRQADHPLEKHALVKAARAFEDDAQHHSDPSIGYHSGNKGQGRFGMPQGAGDWSYIQRHGYTLHLSVRWGVETFAESHEDDPTYLTVYVTMCAGRGDEFYILVDLHTSGRMTYRTSLRGDMNAPDLEGFITQLEIEPNSIGRLQGRGIPVLDPNDPSLLPFSEAQAECLAKWLNTNKTGEPACG